MRNKELMFLVNA